jgi:hypothetical protein
MAMETTYHFKGQFPLLGILYFSHIHMEFYSIYLILGAIR